MKPASVYQPGTVLAGKYRVLGVLGAGGMGVVYEVENERLKKNAALKLLHERPSPERSRRFQREMTADGVICNPHIVETYDAGTLEAGELYLVTELLRGESLAQLIARKGQLDLDEICTLIEQACDGVHAAHEAGVIHRDLKAANLFVVERDNAPFVKILDFGVSKFREDVFQDMTKTSDGVLLGTPYVMAPEQIRGEIVDARTDVYALGVILYECASGRPPFRADSLPMLGVLICEGRPEPLRAVRPDLPDAFCNCVAQAMAVDRARRFADAQALGQELRVLRGQAHAPTVMGEGPVEDDVMRVTQRFELEQTNAPSPNVGRGAHVQKSRSKALFALVGAAFLGALVATVVRLDLAKRHTVEPPPSALQANTPMPVQAETAIASAQPSAPPLMTGPPPTPSSPVAPLRIVQSSPSNSVQKPIGTQIIERSTEPSNEPLTPVIVPTAPNSVWLPPFISPSTKVSSP